MEAKYFVEIAAETAISTSSRCKKCGEICSEWKMSECCDILCCGKCADQCLKRTECCGKLLCDKCHITEKESISSKDEIGAKAPISSKCGDCKEPVCSRCGITCQTHGLRYC